MSENSVRGRLFGTEFESGRPMPRDVLTCSPMVVLCALSPLLFIQAIPMPTMSALDLGFMEQDLTVFAHTWVVESYLSENRGAVVLLCRKIAVQQECPEFGQLVLISSSAKKVDDEDTKDI